MESIEFVSAAVGRARRGGGPTLIACKTCRRRGHSKSDRNRYRAKEEIEEWKALRDPVNLFESELKQIGIIDDAEIESACQSVEATHRHRSAMLTLADYWIDRILSRNAPP